MVENTEPETSEPRWITVRVLRRSILRSAVFSGAFTAGSFAAFALVSGPSKIEIVALPLTLFLAAVAVLPTTALELVARELAPSWRRDGLALLFGAVVGPGGLTVAFAQALFSYTLVGTASFARAAGALSGFSHEVVRPEFLGSVFAIGWLAGPVVVARLRGLGLAKVLGVGLAAALLVSTPLVAVLGTGGSDKSALFVGFCFATAIALPLGAALGDWIEARVRDRWASE